MLKYTRCMEGIHRYQGKWQNEGMGMIQTSIEENALQDFIFQVIRAANPSTAKSVSTVLDKFYMH